MQEPARPIRQRTFRIGLMHDMTIEEEIRIVDLMIDVYAAAHRKAPSGIGMEHAETEKLKAYTHARIKQCRFRSRQEKPFCNVCPVHCYKPAMREKIRLVMRYSGPRMLFRHPVLCLLHLIGTLKSKRSLHSEKKSRDRLLDSTT